MKTPIEQSLSKEYNSTTNDDYNNVTSADQSRLDVASDRKIKTMQNSAHKFDESEAVKAAIDSMLETKAKEAS